MDEQEFKWRWKNANDNANEKFGYIKSLLGLQGQQFGRDGMDDVIQGCQHEVQNYCSDAVGKGPNYYACTEQEGIERGFFL